MVHPFCPSSGHYFREEHQGTTCKTRDQKRFRPLTRPRGRKLVHSARHQPGNVPSTTSLPPSNLRMRKLRSRSNAARRPRRRGGTEERGCTAGKPPPSRTPAPLPDPAHPGRGGRRPPPALGQASPTRLAAFRHRPPGPHRRHHPHRVCAHHCGPARQRNLRPQRGLAVQHLSGLPHRPLVPPDRGCTPPPRPRQHLPDHRRHLHAVRPARPRRDPAHRDASPDLGMRRGRSPVHPGVAPRPALAVHHAVRGPGVDRRPVPARPDPRRGSRPPAAPEESFTASALWCTR